MSHKSRSIANSRYESKRIYCQRKEINRLKKQVNLLENKIDELEYENYIKSLFLDKLTERKI